MISPRSEGPYQTPTRSHRTHEGFRPAGCFQSTNHKWNRPSLCTSYVCAPGLVDLRLSRNKYVKMIEVKAFRINHSYWCVCVCVCMCVCDCEIGILCHAALLEVTMTDGYGAHS